MRKLYVHGSVHHNTILIKMTNKIQLCRIIYYSIISWLLYMFRAILSLIIKSVLTVITSSGFIHMYCCRLLPWLSHVSSDIISHHQERLNCNCIFRFHSHILLSAAVVAQPRQQPTAIHVNETRSCNYS